MSLPENANLSAKTEIVFYVLNSDDVLARENFIGKLIKKIHSEHRCADVLFENITDAQRFDLSLWQLQPQSFIPHSLELKVAAPIQLFGGHLSKTCEDILLNLHPQFQEVFSKYQRTIEILDQTEHLIQKGRERFKQYRQLGIEPIVHKIGFEPKPAQP